MELKRIKKATLDLDQVEIKVEKKRLDQNPSEIVSTDELMETTNQLMTAYNESL
jgi:hypothetical protein